MHLQGPTLSFCPLLTAANTLLIGQGTGIIPLMHAVYQFSKGKLANVQRLCLIASFRTRHDILFGGLLTFIGSAGYAMRWRN